MTLPEYIVNGSVLIDSCGHEYTALHSDLVDDWGAPQIVLVDTDGDERFMLTRDQLEKQGYTLKARQ